MSKINFSYFDNEFVQSIGKITTKLKNLNRVFTEAELPENFEYTQLMNKLIEDTQDATDAKTNLKDCVTAFIQDVQNIENMNMQLADDLSIEMPKIDTYEAGETEDISEYEEKNKNATRSIYGSSKEAISKAKKRAQKDRATLEESKLDTALKGLKEKGANAAEKFADGAEDLYGDTKRRWWTLGRDIKNGDFKAVGKDIVDDAKTTGANAVNSTTAIWKGILGFGENIIDFAATESMAGAASIAKATGHEDEADEIVDEGMKFIAKDWVKGAFDSFYGSKAGKVVDGEASKSLKYGESMYDVGEMAGGLIPFIGAEIATGGKATAITSIMQGASTAGDFAEKDLQSKQINSFEGIEDLYRSNEISKDEYYNILEAYETYKISGLTDVEWCGRMEDAYNNGVIDEDTYNTYVKVATMEGEWTTVDNLKKTQRGATVVGIIDAGAAYTGAKLNKWAGFGSREVVNIAKEEASKVASGEISKRAATSATRVAIDSGLGFLNPIYNAIGDMISKDESFSEAYANRGGLDASKRMALFSGALSAASEYGFIKKNPSLEEGELYVDDIIKNRKKSINKVDAIDESSIEQSIKNSIDTTKPASYVTKQKQKYAKIINKNQDFTKAYLQASKDGDLDILAELLTETGTERDFVKSVSEISLSQDRWGNSLGSNKARSQQLYDFTTKLGIESVADNYSEDLAERFIELYNNGQLNGEKLATFFRQTQGFESLSKEAISKENKNLCELVDMFSDGEHVYGIHRAGSASGQVIVSDGLELTGHGFNVKKAGMIKNGDDLIEMLDDNVTFHRNTAEQIVSDPVGLINDIKGGAYKAGQSTTSDIVIISLPKDISDEELKKIVQWDGSQYKLKPEYIAGYATVDNETGLIVDVTKKNTQASYTIKGIDSAKSNTYITAQKEKYAELINENQDFVNAYLQAAEDGDLDILADLIDETDNIDNLMENQLSIQMTLSNNEISAYNSYMAEIGKSKLARSYGPEFTYQISKMMDEEKININEMLSIVSNSPNNSVPKSAARKEAACLLQIISDIEDDDYYYGVHRAGETVSGEKILKEGLMISTDTYGQNSVREVGKNRELEGYVSNIRSNYSNLKSIDGVDQDAIMTELSNNVSFYSNLGDILHQIKSATDYKPGKEVVNDKCVAVVAIPKNCSDEELKNIIIVKDGQDYLNPEYIVGYVNVDNENGMIKSYVEK